MKILLPVDGSDYTKRMLAYVAAHEEMFGASHEYLALTAVGPVPPEVTQYVDRKTIEDYYRDQAESVLRPVREFAERNGWKLRDSRVVGAAGDAIATFARTQAPDLIVMGSHGHSRIHRALLGSVSEKVLAQSEIPVLLMRGNGCADPPVVPIEEPEQAEAASGTPS